MSLPEVLLWRALRRRSLDLKFRRQHPVPPYVADFYCPEHRLIIEIDGEAHNRGNRPEHDRERDGILVAKGYRVVRVPAADFLADPHATAEAIAAIAANPLHRSPAANGPPPHATHGEDLRIDAQ